MGSPSPLPSPSASPAPASSVEPLASSAFRLVLAGEAQDLARWRGLLARAGSDPRLKLSFVALSDRERDLARLHDLAREHDGIAVAMGERLGLDAVRAFGGRLDRPLLALAERASPDEARALFEAGVADYIAAAADPAAALLIAQARLSALGLARGRDAAPLRAALAHAQDQLASAREASVTDWLTGLGNRRHLDERLDEEENKALRSGLPLSLILLDLDAFKGVNDRYGHLVGDEVLRRVAALVRASLRNYDVPCRYGGEEVALLLPTTALDRAVQVAERLRQRVAAERFEARGEVFWVTASFGVATLPAPGVSTGRELLAAADRCLYHAKSGGRNRVVQDGPDTAADRSSRALYAGARERIEGLLASIRSLTRDAARAHIHAVQALVKLIEEDLRHAFGRAEAVAEAAAAIAARLGLDGGHAATIRRAALFQDLGMVAVGDLVERPGALTEEERALVRRHPAISVQLAEEIGFLDDELPLILHHHERMDGSGYPRGLAGARIPLGARVLAVASAFEAITSGRPYRGARPPAEALDELERHAGSWFDPAVVRAAREALAA